MDNTTLSPEDGDGHLNHDCIMGDMDMRDVEIRDILLTLGKQGHTRGICNSIVSGGIARPIWIIEGGLRRRACQDDRTCPDNMPLQPIDDKCWHTSIADGPTIE